MKLKEKYPKKKYLSMIIESLKKISPYRVMLFGSYAWGEPIEDSDIDLIVITNDTFIPKNYEEKMNVYLKVSKLIRKVRERIPIDLIVYTKPEFEKVKKLNSLFIQEVMESGKVLL